jgi:hypothetical protein
VTELSSRQRQTLGAIAETILPAGRFLPIAGEHTIGKVEQGLEQLPGVMQHGLQGLLRAVDAASWLAHARSFSALAPDKRLALLDGWRTGDFVRRTMLRAIATPLKIAHFDDPSLYRQLGCVYEAQKVRAEAKPAYLRDRVHALDGDLAVDCDVVVIGTGAGGAVVGRELAEAGLAVVFVEEGDYFDRSDFTGRAFPMSKKLYRNAGATLTLGNVAIPLPLGKTVGGTTTVNSGTCFRAPDRVLAHWRDAFGLDELSPDAMGRYFDRVEGVLGVERAKASLLGGNGRVLERGCKALGFTKHGPLKRNAPACDGQGVCCFGCPTDAKRSTNVSYIPLALKAGAELFPGAKVTRILLDGGRATGVVAQTTRHTLTVRARAVVVACGAIYTPLLLARQRLGVGSGWLGKNLSIHPAAGCLGELDELVQCFKGIPQGYSIEDHLDEGILYEGSMIPLEMTMTMTQLIGPELVRLAESFDHVSGFGFVVEDSSRGSVSEAFGQPLIKYWLGDGDIARIKRGIDVVAQVYFAAGARTVHTPIHGFDRFRSPDDLVAFRRATLRATDLDLSAYHPLGTARMGRDPATSVVNQDNQVHDTPGLYVVDGASVPGALGVNPQVTIMALATRAAENIAAALA